MSKSAIIFMGTPQFAVPSLEALSQSGHFEIKAVVTQPDRPAGRGQKLRSPAVKDAAEKLNIPVFQPKSLKTLSLAEDEFLPNGKAKLLGRKSSTSLAELINSCEQLAAFVVVAYGKIIPSLLFDYADCGFVNIHPSMLPRWRGAAPIQLALFSGDAVTGTTVMQIDDGLDTGPIYCQEELAITASHNYGTLMSDLADISAKLLAASLPDIVAGKLSAKPQGDEGATYADKWEGKDLQVKWSEDAEVTLRRIKTCAPFQGARTMYEEDLVKIFDAELSDASADFPRTTGDPGEIIHVDKEQLLVSAGSSTVLSIKELQFPGKKRLPIEEILKGNKLSVGKRFEEMRESEEVSD